MQAIRRAAAAVITAAAMTVLAVNAAAAEVEAEIVDSRRIWDPAPRNAAGDLVRFQDRWFVVCRESTGVYTQDGALRVITSVDGKKWESTALITSPTPNKSLSDPKFAVTPDGRLMLTAEGIFTSPHTEDAGTEFGGVVKTLAWFSADGRNFTGGQPIGLGDHPSSRVAWHKNKAYAYSHGCSCGNAQSVLVSSSGDGQRFEILYEETFSGFFPSSGSMLFSGDAAHCLMSRTPSGSGAEPTGFLGTSQSPYQDWTWKPLDATVRHPNLLSLPDGRTLAAVGLTDPKPRTSLCRLDLATGRLIPLLDLPTTSPVGLAHHADRLWVLYHSQLDGRLGVHLAEVKLK